MNVGGMNEWHASGCLAACPLPSDGVPHHQATSSVSTQVPLWDVRLGAKEHPGAAGTLLTHLHTKGHHPQARLGVLTSPLNSSWLQTPA